MNKEKWQKVDRNEQESIMLLDYAQKEIDFYTSRESVYKRIAKTIGSPTKIYYNKQLITGVRWEIPFEHKLATKFFSKRLLIGNLK